MAESLTPHPNLMLQAARALDAVGVEWMLTGSFATNLYAEPRFTADADFVVHLEQTSVSEIARHLPDFNLDPQMTFETNTSTVQYVFRHVAEQFTVELFELSDDPHDQERFRRRRKINYSGHSVFVPTPEDIVVQKLRWYPMTRRPKDRDDARNVVESLHGSLDWPYIESWCDRHGTRRLLEQLREEVRLPPA